MKRLLSPDIRYQNGFTLIEMMIVIFILGLLLAIAMPSYQAYLERNTQHKVKAIMTAQAGELERWRSRQFNYKGFISQKVKLDSSQPTYDYPQTGPTKYQLKLVTINNHAETPISGATGTTVANNWVILATPQESGLPYIGLTSRGVKCQSLDSSITAVKIFDEGNCGTRSESW